MALCVRPSQQGTTGQEENMENGWEESAYALLCCFRSTRHMTYSGVGGSKGVVAPLKFI